jgi:acyl-CoA thioesterase-1
MISANNRTAVMHAVRVAAVLAAAVLAGCGREPRAPRARVPASPASPAARASPGPATSRPAVSPETPDDLPVVLFLGTSLTAGLGVDPDEAYPALVQRKIDAAGLRYRVRNAGVSGETSAGALRRVDWVLRQPVSLLVVETGANDGLRGQDPEHTRANIQAIFDAARRRQPPPRLALVAMEALPNYGEDYRRRFRAVFPELARRNNAVLIPFLLEGIAGDPRLNQQDGVHPTAEGHRRVAETVWKALQPVLAAGRRSP